MLNRSVGEPTATGACGAAAGPAVPTIASAALAMALRMRGVAPHGHMFGIASICSSVGRGLAFKSAAMAMMKPGSQKPH